MSIRPFYDRWPSYNAQLRERVAAMTEAELGLQPDPERWPIWATVAHTVGARAYWLCGILGEPGAESTPFPDALSGEGWEDDLEHRRSAEELVWAIDSTWAIVEGVLDRWTPTMLADGIERRVAAGTQIHSRGSIV